MHPFISLLSVLCVFPRRFLAFHADAGAYEVSLLFGRQGLVYETRVVSLYADPCCRYVSVLFVSTPYDWEPEPWLELTLYSRGVSLR